MRWRDCAVDLLFNNAGVEGVLAPLGDYPVESVDELLATNVTAPV